MLPRVLNKLKKNRTTILAVIFVMVVFLFGFLTPVLGQGPVVGTEAQTDTFGMADVENAIPLTGIDIRIVIAKIIRAVLSLLGLISLGIILYAGFLIMTSGGNEEKVSKGRKTLINAVIGIVIILSSFAIVQFVINSLSNGGRGGGNDANVKPPALLTFEGTGALGGIIKDHYPSANQDGVPRNTKIIVTFSEPIVPESIIENTNNNCWDAGGSLDSVDCDETNTEPYYGDCVVVDEELSCDKLKKSAVQIYKLSDKDENTELVNEENMFEGDVMAMYEDGDKHNAYIFVFNPDGNLGSAEENVWHEVVLTNEILRKQKDEDGDYIPAFENQVYGKYYKWQFETDVNIDLDPPYVVNVDPVSGETVKRNFIIQATFNEAMDPTAVQGVLASDSIFSNIILNSFDEDGNLLHSSDINGEWKISNGYRSVEFIPSDDCGQNSCGENMYCLPVECSTGVKNCDNEYQVLVLTASLKGSAESPFEALPFSGAMDIAGNALDSVLQIKDGKKEFLLSESDAKPTDPDEHKPDIGEIKIIEAEEVSENNFWWSFKVNSEIDRTAPYIEQVNPKPDSQDVLGKEPLWLRFSKRMLLNSLYDIHLYEYSDESLEGIPGIGHNPYSNNSIHEDVKKTTTNISTTREFGPNNLDLYYFVTASSSVKDSYQNCLYPGRGPDVGSIDCDVTYNDDGTVIDSSGCVDFSSPISGEEDTGCVQGTDDSQILKSDVPSCLSTMQDDEISIFY